MYVCSVSSAFVFKLGITWNFGHKVLMTRRNCECSSGRCVKRRKDAEARKAAEAPAADVASEIVHGY